MEPFIQKAFTGKIYKPDSLPMSKLKYVHPLVLRLFQSHSIEDFPLAGRLKNFRRNWEKVTNNPEILRIVLGLKKNFLERPYKQNLLTKQEFQGRSGSESYVGERCRSKSQGYERPISRQLVSCVKKGRWKETSCKLKEFELQ